MFKSIFKRSSKIPVINPSVGKLDILIEKLKKLNIQSGGLPDVNDPLSNLNGTGLSEFDARKLLITKKLEFIRKSMRDMTTQKLIGSTYIRKKNDIRKMVQFVKLDFKSLRILFRKVKKKKVVDKKLMKRMQRDMDIIAKHIQQVHDISMERYTRRKSKRNHKKRKSFVYKKIDNFYHTKVLQNDYNNNENENDSDYENLKLPPINITREMEIVNSKKKELSQHLKILTKKLCELKETAITIGDELDCQHGIIKKTEKKVDKRTKELNKVRKSAKKLKKGVNTQVRLFLLITLAISGVLGTLALLGVIVIL